MRLLRTVTALCRVTFAGRGFCTQFVGVGTQAFRCRIAAWQQVRQPSCVFCPLRKCLGFAAGTAVNPSRDCFANKDLPGAPRYALCFTR
jgi:hypothetical protein